MDQLKGKAAPDPSAALREVMEALDGLGSACRHLRDAERRLERLPAVHGGTVIPYPGNQPKREPVESGECPPEADQNRDRNVGPPAAPAPGGVWGVRIGPLREIASLYHFLAALRDVEGFSGLGGQEFDGGYFTARCGGAPEKMLETVRRIFPQATASMNAEGLTVVLAEEERYGE